MCNFHKAKEVDCGLSYCSKALCEYLISYIVLRDQKPILIIIYELHRSVAVREILFMTEKSIYDYLHCKLNYQHTPLICLD